MDHINTLLPKVLKKRGLYEHAEASIVVSDAQEWLTEALPELKDDIVVSTLKDAVLLIYCDHSVALQEAHMQQEALKEYLSQKHPSVNIESIHFIRQS